MKMVTNATDSNPNSKLPAKIAYHYVDKGHKGNHCHCGLPAKAGFGS